MTCSKFNRGCWRHFCLHTTFNTSHFWLKLLKTVFVYTQHVKQTIFLLETRKTFLIFIFVTEEQQNWTKRLTFLSTDWLAAHIHTHEFRWTSVWPDVPNDWSFFLYQVDFSIPLQLQVASGHMSPPPFPLAMPLAHRAAGNYFTSKNNNKLTQHVCLSSG